MDRRLFLGMAAAAAPSFSGPRADGLPAYKIVSPHKPTGAGMPGRWPGRVASVHANDSIDEATGKINAESAARMLSQAIRTLTGDKDARDAWARFFNSSDVVGIKINASGAPKVCSSPEIVGEIAANLVKVGVKPDNIWVHERFESQVKTVPYAQFLPSGAHVVTADSHLGYDPFTFVEVSFFGEDDTRSNLVRTVSDTFTKIINVPNMKDHGASGVTGCLKNIAYGEFGNVARSHQYSDTNTLSFIGTLASVEPLRSKTVLHIMDGIKGVWHGGPFVHQPQFVFYPKQIMAGTDPVAMDRLLLDIIEAKRKQEGAISVWDRSENRLQRKGAGEFRKDPNVNSFVREPGHIEFAGKLGLGVYDKAKIDLREVRL